MGAIVYNNTTSKAFSIKSGVRQGCVLAPTMFGIIFSVLLKCALGTATVGMYLRTRSNGNLFNLSRLQAKTKVQLRLLMITDLLFADDASITTHTAENLQQLLNRLAAACRAFGLTISLKKTQVMGQDVDKPPSVSISDYELEQYSALFPSTPSLTDASGRAQRHWPGLRGESGETADLTGHTKAQVYMACVVSTRLYCSETWTLCSH